MKTALLLIASVMSLLLSGIGLTPAHAQATRTWVSGVGDDANPCSRTAPCKTFAGAISKTAAGGEINCLDPGGFGGVTITKSIQIFCDTGTAGVLVSGTNAIIVNLPANTDEVFLRGLDIIGLGTGLSGINFIGRGTLHVSKNIVRQFTTAGIRFAPIGPARLFVQDTYIAENTTAGIAIVPGAGGSALVDLNGVNANNNTIGIQTNATAGGTIIVSVRDSLFGSNTQFGVNAISTGAQSSVLLVNSTIANSGSHGLVADGSNAVIRISKCTVVGNSGTFNVLNSGLVFSYLDNNIDGNVPNNLPQSTPLH